MMPARRFPGMFAIQNRGFCAQILSNETQGASMAIIVSPARNIRRPSVKSPVFTTLVARYSLLLGSLVLCVAVLSSGGCQTAKPVVSQAANRVDNYFGGPFLVTGSPVTRPSAAAFDHSANQIAVLGTIINNATHIPVQVPVNTINGAFTSADTGFLAITENFTTPASGTPIPQNPVITGAWAVEIPGAGALANFLSVYNLTSPATISAAPIAMAQNTACPSFTNPSPFLYVTVPYKGMLADLVDYGTVGISSQGSAVTFSNQPFLVGSLPQAAATATGGCSQTVYGAVTAYPLNSFGSSGPLPELIGISSSGLLVSNFNPTFGGVGAFGGGTGVLGVAEPASALSVNSVISAQYNGFVFSPSNPVKQANGYDITVLASSFGNHAAMSQACSALQASLTANNSQGGPVPVLPSANSIYGGEFLTVSAAGSVNDPTGASGSENCDVVIDLGTQDPSNNGSFPNATVFIGSNFPPFSASNPWRCVGGGVCAISFPAAAIVGQAQGQYVIFVTASGVSAPPAQLPDGSGNLQPQPVGIYLFQKM